MKNNSIKSITIIVDANLDFQFWAIIPALNINLHTKSFEFEWLCIGVYISRLNSNEQDREPDMR